MTRPPEQTKQLEQSIATHLARMESQKEICHAIDELRAAAVRCAALFAGELTAHVSGTPSWAAALRAIESVTAIQATVSDIEKDSLLLAAAVQRQVQGFIQQLPGRATKKAAGSGARDVRRPAGKRFATKRAGTRKPGAAQ